MSDTLQLILDKLNAIEDRQKDIQLEQRILYRQMEALFSLYHQIDFKAHLLNMRSWVASPDFLAVLSALIQEYQPMTIFEAGGGTTTLISAYSLQAIGRGHVYAVDHKKEFVDSARNQIEQHNLSDYATVIYAPLVSKEVDGEMWQWYDISKFKDVDEIDLLVVDGPPQYDNPNPMARYPALPLMKNKLNSGAIILVDDADRDDDKKMTDLWEKQFPLQLLRYYERAWADIDKGAKVYCYADD